MPHSQRYFHNAVPPAVLPERTVLAAASASQRIRPSSRMFTTGETVHVARIEARTTTFGISYFSGVPCT